MVFLDCETLGWIPVAGIDGPAADGTGIVLRASGGGVAAMLPQERSAPLHGDAADGSRRTRRFQYSFHGATAVSALEPEPGFLIGGCVRISSGRGFSTHCDRWNRPGRSRNHSRTPFGLAVSARASIPGFLNFTVPARLPVPLCTPTASSSRR